MIHSLMLHSRVIRKILRSTVAYLLTFFITFGPQVLAQKKITCLSTCSALGLTKDNLQQCVNRCVDMGHCCGYRLDGIGPKKRQYLVPGVVHEAEKFGFTWINTQRIEDNSYGSGYSMYVPAWPMMVEYPGYERFQSGLSSSWLEPQKEPNEDYYQTIEGGLGWWHDTRFGTETPKFIMGAVSHNFDSWANGVGAGSTDMRGDGHRDWSMAGGKYGAAQLSPYVLWPPDGLNMKQGMNGELLGYGYIPLPLTEPMDQTAGQDIPTGNQAWTLFLNAENFKGPVAFVLPTFWSKPALEDKSLEGMFFDVRPSNQNIGFGIEHAGSPALVGHDDSGTAYARISKIAYPPGQNRRSLQSHKITVYSKEALWNKMVDWFNGGQVVEPGINSAGAQPVSYTLGDNGGSTFGEINVHEDEYEIDTEAYVETYTVNGNEMGFEFNTDFVSDTEDGFVLPEFFRLDKQNERWRAVLRKDVPESTGLLDQEIEPGPRNEDTPYLTPLEQDCHWQDPDGPWANPGPQAGPFWAQLGDGSTLKYYWYRFVDQPAIVHANLSDDQRNILQKRVELLHQNWNKEDEYLDPPTVGELASLDPGLLVVPPAGMEVGYVPIVTRQEKIDTSTEEPQCLKTCTSGSVLTANILQQCVDKCMDLGHCCGNRLDGIDTWSSNQRLSCANGCEIAFYSTSVSECSAQCEIGNQNGCDYEHPSGIPETFGKCGDCQCGEWPKTYACSDGCEQALNFAEFYKFEGNQGNCKTEEKPRFLFAGQSNMEGHSEQARSGLFADLVDILNNDGINESQMRAQMIQILNEAEESTVHSSENEADLLLGLKDFMGRDTITSDHSSMVCSFTDPAQTMDCERPVSPTACGYGTNQYGPELMFSHVFPTLGTSCDRKDLGVLKFARGGTEIYKHWSKGNSGSDENFWNEFKQAIWAAKGSIKAFVWFQGENDSFDDWNKQNYHEHLTRFVSDVRNEIYDSSGDSFESASQIPVVIVELGQWIHRDVSTEVIEAQRKFVESDEYSVLVSTGGSDDTSEQLSAFYHFEAASILIIGDRIARALSTFFRGADGNSCDVVTSPPVATPSPTRSPNLRVPTSSPTRSPNLRLPTSSPTLSDNVICRLRKALFGSHWV